VDTVLIGFGDTQMFVEVFKNFAAMMFTFAAGFGVLGLLIWVLAAQGEAKRLYSYICWGLAVLLIVVGLMR